MELRPYQRAAVAALLADLRNGKHPLGVAATGAGKTVIFSFVAARMLRKRKKKIIIFAHRDRLIEQNKASFERLANFNVSIYDGASKDCSGQVVFAMVQSFSRGEIEKILLGADLLIFDEAHRVASTSYMSIIKKAKSMGAQVMGVTATPERGDQRGLGAAFNTISFSISMGDLINEGALARPTFHQLASSSFKKSVANTLKDSSRECLDERMEALLNKEDINLRIVESWLKIAPNEPTIIFCVNRKHAIALSEAFKRQGIPSMPLAREFKVISKKEVKNALKAFENGSCKVITNVAILTEGYDCPSIRCVIIAKPICGLTFLTQAIGRGSRKMSGKDTFKVIDFGDSITSDLIAELSEPAINLNTAVIKKAKKRKKRICQTCGAEVPFLLDICAICGIDQREDKNKANTLIPKALEFSQLDFKGNSIYYNVGGNVTCFMAAGRCRDLLSEPIGALYLIIIVKHKNQEHHTAAAVKAYNCLKLSSKLPAIHLYKMRPKKFKFFGEALRAIKKRFVLAEGDMSPMKPVQLNMLKRLNVPLQYWGEECTFSKAFLLLNLYVYLRQRLIRPDFKLLYILMIRMHEKDYQVIEKIPSEIEDLYQV